MSHRVVMNDRLKCSGCRQEREPTKEEIKRVVTDECMFCGYPMGWIKVPQFQQEESKIMLTQTYRLELSELVKTLNTVFDDLEYWKQRAMPKHGETWIKDSCSNGMCRVGWSLGVGEYVVNLNNGMDYDSESAIKCGCLRKKS